MLESLMHEFGARLEQVLADPGCSVDEICLFWEGYWADRMVEEMEALASDELSDEQRLAAERIGVVWSEPRRSIMWKGSHNPIKLAMEAMQKEDIARLRDSLEELWQIE